MPKRDTRRAKKPKAAPLTKRHKEVIRLLSLGCTVNEAAAIQIGRAHV